MQYPLSEVTLTLAELGIKPGAAVEFAQTGPVSISAEGSVVAYLLSAEHYEMLCGAVGKTDFAELLQQAEIGGGDLTDVEIEGIPEPLLNVDKEYEVLAGRLAK